MSTPRHPLLIVATGLLLSSSMVSCVSPYYGYAGPNQGVGGVVGAGAGALAGAVIGNQSGRSLEGAAIGGLLGAVAGSVVGNAQDQIVYGPPRAYYEPAPVVYRNYYRPAPVIVHQPCISPVYAFGGGGWGGWGGGGWRGGNWGGGYCAPRRCW